jgi:hypothetical protein
LMFLVPTFVFMETKINKFKAEHCTETECLPLVENIKNLLKNPESYEPIGIRLQQQKGNQITVTTSFKSNDGLHSGIGWVDMNGKVLHFALD